jgi:diguanylate cyclase (GGDEF)-like protein
MDDWLLRAATRPAPQGRRVVDQSAPCLILLYPLGPDLGKRYDLLESNLLAGRDLACGVHLPHPRVSRRHARLERRGEDWAVVDLGSTNGTFVNGQRVREGPLREADLLAMGDVVLKFLVRRGEEVASLEELRRRATQDPLTGIASRAYLLAQLERELAACARTRLPLSLALIDVDRFKDVNDAHGHVAGDAVLRAVAQRLQQRLRATDVLGRYGGEEFMALLRDTPREAALTVMEQVRELVAASLFPVAGAEVSVTISAGVATVSEGVPPNVLINLADASLYRAKQAGRDRVVG